MPRPRTLVPCCPDAIPLPCAWAGGWRTVCPECLTAGPLGDTRERCITLWNIDARQRTRRDPRPTTPAKRRKPQ